MLQDPAVWQSFGNVGVFLLINVPLTVVLSLLLATALNKIVHAAHFFRVSYYVPYVTASRRGGRRVAVPLHARTAWSTTSSGRSRPSRRGW